MADPKIKYDIEANVSGNAEVGQLASKLEQLAGTLDGELKTAALASADALRQLAQKDGAIQNFVALKQSAGEAAARLTDAQAAAQKMGQTLAAAETPTRAQTGSMAKLADAVRAAKTQVTEQNLAVQNARTALGAYGISTDNLGQSQRNIKAAIAAAKTEVQAMAPAWQKAADGAAASAGKQVQSAKQIESGLDSLKGQLNSLRNIAVAALGGSYIGSLAKDVAETADAYNNLQARIKLVTGEGAAFQSAFEGVTAVAQRTSSSLESTGNLFAKLAQAGQAMGVGQAEALALTETVNQAVQLSGASAGASDAAITQLIQGLQSGVLRGDEFNSVMEQSPRLAKALADGLGTTTGELRKMAEAGQLSSDVVIKALQGQADAVAGEFSKLPPTVGRAIQNLSTSWTLYVGETDKATGASTLAASAINALANNLNTIGGYLIDAGQAAAAFVAIRLAQHFTAMALAATQATTAVAANTAAVTAAGVAGSTAAVGVGRFAAILSSLKLFSLLGIVTNFHDIGTAIGEGTAKLMGYKDRTAELAAEERANVQIIADTVAQRKRMAEATQQAIDKSFALSKTAKASVAEFDTLTKAGSTAAEAVAKIGKDFDLASVKGIKDATAVLDKLVFDGKLSASEFQNAWGDALKGADLAVFETNARTAFAGTAREAQRLGQVLDATLRESIKRTGLDFDVISGGMSKASVSAINDTQTMINGLDRLKSMGVDTAQVLSVSLGKGISTADSQKAIEQLRAQIESVRKVLGDKIADGLLDQAKQKTEALKGAMDAALPGINSVAEAMKTLGVVSDRALKDTAAQSKTAFDEMRNSGTASVRELADGFKKYAADAIAANGGVATEAIKTQAAIYGLEVTTDRAGKAIVRAMDDGRDATDRFRGAVHSATVATEEQIRATERLREITSKPVSQRDKVDRDNPYGLTSDGLKANKDGSAAGTFGSTLPIDQADKLKRAAETGQTVDMTQAEYDAAKKQARDALTFIQEMSKLSAGSVSVAAQQDAQALVNAANSARVNITDKSATDKATNKATTPTAAKTYTVNVTLPGSSPTTINTSSDADAQALIALLQRAKLSSN